MRSEPLPPQLQQIVDKALAKDPKDRYQKIVNDARRPARAFCRKSRARR